MSINTLAIWTDIKLLLTTKQATWKILQPDLVWNVHQTSTRTNNMVEGWHSRLNRYVRRLHPNLHQLVKELQKEQAMTQLTVQRARLGGAPPARRMKYVRIDEEVQRLTHKFDLDEITPMEYISGLRRVIHHY